MTPGPMQQQRSRIRAEHGSILRPVKRLHNLPCCATWRGERSCCSAKRIPIYEIHRWQLAVATMLHALHPNIAIGFEMFPRAVQDVLDDWVAGKLSTRGIPAGRRLADRLGL